MKDEIFASYVRHEQTLNALFECDWLSTLIEEEKSPDQVKDCLRLQLYIIELAEKFGCRIENKREVIAELENDAKCYLTNI